MPRINYKHSEETKKKIGKANSISLKGNVPWNKGKKTGLVPSSAFKKGDPRVTGVSSLRWVGDLITYSGVHKWIKKEYGLADCCDECGGINGGKRYEWSNISGKYRRDRDDWRKLCSKCHRNIDGNIPKGWVTRRINLGKGGI